MQDAIREFLHGKLKPDDVVRPTPDNARKIVEAGELFASALALMIATRFEDVTFDPAPIYAADLSRATTTPWRVGFSWQASHNKKELSNADEDVDDDIDELDMT